MDLGRRNLIVTLLSTSAVFAGIGATVSYVRPPSHDISSAGISPISHSGVDDDAVAALADYARASGNMPHKSNASTGAHLPDVETMIARLVERLAAAPEDVAGWRMLGWSYANTERPEQAAAAYAKAAELEAGHRTGAPK